MSSYRFATRRLRLRAIIIVLALAVSSCAGAPTPVAESPTSDAVASEPADDEHTADDVSDDAPPPDDVSEPTGMDLDGLDEVLREVGTGVRGGDGAWELAVGGVTILCLADPAADRMRLVAPIIELASVSDVEQRAMLEANYHTALDARYAVSEGFVVAAYIHPLSPLTPTELRSALNQVASLVHTFGNTYSSGELQFGSPGDDSDAPEEGDAWQPEEI